VVILRNRFASMLIEVNIREAYIPHEGTKQTPVLDHKSAQNLRARHSP